MGRGRPRLRPARADGAPRRTTPSSPPSAAQRLAAYKVPRRFDFVAEFPRTSAGKIQKHLLGIDGGKHRPAAARKDFAAGG